MNEVKKSDIELVLNSLWQYLNHATQTNSANLQEFVNFMEPIFEKAGYRTPSTGGGADPNILIIHDVGAGDFITQSGAIREIRRLYPTAHITLIVSPSVDAIQLAETCPYINEIIHNTMRWDFHKSFFMGYGWNMELAKLLLTTRFDICYSFTHVPATPTLMYFSGARTRITHLVLNDDPLASSDIPLKYTINLATHIVPPYEFGKHIIDAHFSLVDYFLHTPVANREIEVWYTPTEFTIAKNLTGNLSRPLYALTMGASAPIRRYPPEKFAELIKLILAEEPTATFINLGGGQTDEQSAQILSQSLGEEIFNKHVVNLVNRINYRQSAAIMKFCDMYIGNNTGALWLACATKCPVLVVESFPKDLDSGHLDIPRLFSPYKVPAISVQPKHALPECAVNEPYINYACRANKPHCITQIEPQTLFEGFKLLKKKISKKIIDTTYIC